MHASETHTNHEGLIHESVSRTAGGLTVERIGTVAVIILAILGLSQFNPGLMACISAIIIGACLLVEGWARGNGFGHQLTDSTAAPSAATQEFYSNLTSEFLGGVAGVVLGILALFQPASATLLAVALLVYGSSLLLSLWSMANAQWFAARSGHLLTGLGAVVLGILAVIGFAPFTLVLAGLLGLAATTLFSHFSFMNDQPAEAR